MESTIDVKKYFLFIFTIIFLKNSLLILDLYTYNNSSTFDKTLNVHF